MSRPRVSCGHNWELISGIPRLICIIKAMGKGVNGSGVMKWVRAITKFGYHPPRGPIRRWPVSGAFNPTYHRSSQLAISLRLTCPEKYRLSMLRKTDAFKKIFNEQFIFLRLITIILFILPSILLSACSSFIQTKPNLPKINYPGYNKIYELNPLLANELGKLPDLQNGYSEIENRALSTITIMYEQNMADFEKVFSTMYNVGLPTVRKYCSPLQALFWLASENIVPNDFFKEYSLDKLLDNAWVFEKQSVLNEGQILTVIDAIKNLKDKKQY